MHIVTPEGMRSIEGRAIHHLGIDGLILMERAAYMLATEIMLSRPRRVLAVCGVGNNGGDAYAAARMLHLWGIDVAIAPLCPMDKLSGDALKNASICKNLGIPVIKPDDDFSAYDVIIDGIFGTGLSREPQGVFADAIARINSSGAAVYSVDIPSGIDGANGQVLGTCVDADVTVTFQWAKRGHYLYPAPRYVGKLVIADIGIPPPDAWDGDAEILDDTMVERLCPSRARDAYKNQFGHALLIAGSTGMAGAAVISATACMRAGAGLLTVCAPETSVVPHVQSRVPVAMCIPFAETEDLAEVIQGALKGKTAVGYGCGSGRTHRSSLPLEPVLASHLPAVIDADGLYHLAAKLPLLRRDAGTVLTPHMGEMARMLGRPVQDPVKDALGFAKQHGVVVLLKGACTVIAAPNGRLTFNVTGTNGMATAGSGDALTGIILSLLAQGLCAYDAARVGAYVHAKAGLAAEKAHGTASMTAMDLADSIQI